jgi:hypothetical protein
VRGDRARLARVIHLGVEKIVEAPVDLTRHRVKHVRALWQRQPTPRALQRRGSRLHGQLDLLAATLRDRSDETAVDRGELVELPLRSRLHKPIVNEMQEIRRAHEGRTLRSCRRPVE